MAARVEVEGLEHVPSSGAFILAGNHLSMSDVPVGWPHMERSIIPLVSHDLRQTRWLRWVLSGIGHAVYIRRGEGDEDALTRGLAVLRAGGAILIAPEGKRSPGGLRRGNTGAAYLATRAGVPVVPVAAWGQEDFTSNWRRLRRAPVRLQFGPPLDFPVGPLTSQELQEHSERIMLEIARMLPPEYRGVYADAVAAESVEPTPGGVTEQRDTVGVTEPQYSRSSLRAMAKPPHVLVLGGGFVAHGITRALRRQIRHGEVTVTVVDRDNFFTFHGLIGEMVSGRVLPSNILNPARRVFAPAQVHGGEIETVDLGEKRVSPSAATASGPSSGTTSAVVSLGNGENLEAYPGLAEHAYRLKSFDDCFRLKNHIIEMFELADLEADPDERRRLLTFFIAGGGFSGSELAGELADFTRRLAAREYPGIRREECRVVIVHPGATLLPEFYGSKNAERSTRSYPRPHRVRDEACPQAGRGAHARDESHGSDAERGLPLERRAHSNADDRQRSRVEAVAAPR